MVSAALCSYVPVGLKYVFSVVVLAPGLPPVGYHVHGPRGTGNRPHTVGVGTSETASLFSAQDMSQLIQLEHTKFRVVLHSCASRTPDLHKSKTTTCTSRMYHDRSERGAPMQCGGSSAVAVREVSPGVEIWCLVDKQAIFCMKYPPPPSPLS